MPWRPPRESARRRHSIFVDVELWDEHDGRRIWSCPMLAAVWQLIRLGLLRDHGRPVLVPEDWTGAWPDSWAELPPITRLEPGGGRLRRLHHAVRLSPRFLPVELAVRTILSQFAGDPAVLAETRAPGRPGRHARCPPSWSNRIRYVFMGPARRRPGMSAGRAGARPAQLGNLALRVGRLPQLGRTDSGAHGPGRASGRGGAHDGGPGPAVVNVVAGVDLVARPPESKMMKSKIMEPQPFRDELIIEHQ